MKPNLPKLSTSHVRALGAQRRTVVPGGAYPFAKKTMPTVTIDQYGNVIKTCPVGQWFSTYENACSSARMRIGPPVLVPGFPV